MLNRVVVAPSGFKESLSAPAAADAIAAGVRRVLPDAEIDRVPLVDGGGDRRRAGPGDRRPAGRPGRHRPRRRTGRHPLRPAGRAGHRGGGDGGGRRSLPGPPHPPRPGRHHHVRRRGADPRRAGPRGAADPGRLRRLGHLGRGAGALQALGARLLDADGVELPFGGRELSRLARIDAAGLDPRLGEVELVVACNPYNVLCGERGWRGCSARRRGRPAAGGGAVGGAGEVGAGADP